MSGLAAVFAFALGASVGSFVNVVADRLPAGRSLVRPASCCETCKEPLGPLDLVPLLSYLWLRGRCRYCRAAIPPRLPLVEASSGLLFIGANLRYGLGADFAMVCGSLSLLLAIALIDLEHRLILNSILLPSVVAALALAPLWTEVGLPRLLLGTETMLASFLNAVLAGVGAFLALLVVFLVYPRGMGAGDVKLAGLVGLLAGYPGAAVALWLAFVMGGLVAALLMGLRRRGRRDAIPFGPFLALGAAVALLWAEPIASRYSDWVGSW